VGVLAIALVDGMGIPVALGDPEIAGPDAALDVLGVLRDILGLADTAEAVLSGVTVLDRG